jgi:hypothetical protein
MHLADALEEQLVREPRLDPIARASVYALLFECGRALPARTIWADEELRTKAPLLWTELLLPLIHDVEQKQALILSAAREGAFHPSDFATRFDEMRELVGRNPVAARCARVIRARRA